jgi:nickel-dependent lactate racemase
MRIAIDYGWERLQLEVAAERLVAGPRAGVPDLTDPAAAVRAAVEAPFGFPPLRAALTPDDHVTVVVDEHLPGLARLLVPVLEHVTAAGVDPAALTLLCPESVSGQPWVDELPDAFADAHVEVHDPRDRNRLSYLATMRKGKRLYLNRSAVDADQLVVLGALGYDPVLGYGGATGAIYPALSDQETQAEFNGRARLDVPGGEPWPARADADEGAWLLGAPFFVQLIEGASDNLADVVAGTADAAAEGRRRLDARWRRRFDRAADLVVAGVSGDPSRHTFADLAAAAANAARVVRPGGRIVLLTAARPDSIPGHDLLREADEPHEVLEELRGRPPRELVPALRWASAADHARLSLLSGLPEETAEEIFAAPLASGGAAQRLLDAGGTCLFLDDAHKTLATLE